MFLLSTLRSFSWQGAAVALGLPMEENIEKLLGTEQITFDTFFQKMTVKLTPEDHVDEIMAIFELFDSNASGTIDYAKLESVSRLIGAAEQGKDIQDMLNMLDTDHDGELDPIDFYTCLISGMRLRMEEENIQRRAQDAHSKHGGGTGSRSAGTRMSSSALR